MPLTTIIPILLSLAALVLPGILKSDHLADWQNALISGAVVALFAALTVWAGGQFTGNLPADWALFAAAYSALLAGPLRGLDETLQSGLNLPFLKPPAANPNPVRIPTALTMPAPGVPPRASARDAEKPPGA